MSLTVYTREGRAKDKGGQGPPGGVVARAALASVVSVASAAGGGLAPLVFNAKHFDPYSLYDTSTGRFTAKTAGYYRVTCALLWQNASANMRSEVNLRKNGAHYLRLADDITGVASDWGVSGTGTVYLNAGDYAEIWPNQNSGSAKSLYGAPTEVWAECELVAASVGVTPEPWQPLPAGSWTNTDSSIYAPASFRKMPDGTVVLRGMVNTTSADFATLPLGYRPAYTVEVAGVFYDAAPYKLGLLQIRPNGILRSHNTSGSGTSLNYFHLDNIRFAVD